MTERLEALGQHIQAALDNEIVGQTLAYGELGIEARADVIGKVLTFLRDDDECRFKQLIDITAVDYPTRDKRFDVVYHLLSLHHNCRLRVKAQVGEGAAVPSIVEIYPTAGWFERETWDMYGIMFAGHPDLRRILTDYGFQGHPLRKDFPLTGFVELRYSEEHKRVVYEPVKLTQDFRSFDFLSPWEGAKYILPGDEKAGDQETAKS
ncbi:MAG: NADH-quinone oxidoreductase subunit C [Pseudomonadota bacterium]